MADPASTVIAGGGSSTATTTPSFSAQPAGTLLTLHVSSDDYRTTVGSNRPESSGWTLLQSGEDFLGSYLWYLVAAGSETSVSYTIGSAVSSAYTVVAHTNVDNASPWDVSTVSHTHGGASTPTPSSGATSAGRRYIIGAAGAMHSSTSITGASGWTNSYAEIWDQAGPASGSREIVAAASLAFDGGGTPATTSATWAGTSQLCSYGISAVAKVSSGSAAAVDGWVLLRPGFMVGEAFPPFLASFSAPFSTDAATSAPLTVDVDPAILSLSGIDPSATGSGAATQTVDVAALTLTGVDPAASGSGVSSTAVDVASLTLTGVDPAAAGAGVASQAVDVAALTLTGIDPGAAGTGTASQAADPAVLTLTGIDPTASGTGVAAQAVDVAILVLSGVDVSASAGAILQAVDTATLSLTGVDLTASGSGGAAVALNVAALTLVGIDPTATGSGVSAVLADTATLTLTGVTPGATGTGTASLAVDSAVLTLTGVDVIGSVVPAFVPDPNPQTVTVTEQATATAYELATATAYEQATATTYELATATAQEEH